jgi:hypothetical protein
MSKVEQFSPSPVKSRLARSLDQALFQSKPDQQGRTAKESTCLLLYSQHSRGGQVSNSIPVPFQAAQQVREAIIKLSPTADQQSRVAPTKFFYTGKVVSYVVDVG